MKKALMIFVATFVAIAVAMPALAAVEFQYGGVFRTPLDHLEQHQRRLQRHSGQQ